MTSLDVLSDEESDCSHQASTGFFKVLGAILLIVGTSIGGGMLALPVATAKLGFFPASLYLFLTWMMMTFGALLVLEVNLWLPANSNLISMAGATIGRVGQVISWLSYLVLLYCLLAAYIAGGRDVLQTVFALVGVHLSSLVSASFFLVFFGVVVARGMSSVDWVNRFIMMVKFTAYVAVVLFAIPYVQSAHFSEASGHYKLWMSTLMVMITSFGFAIIVPSLRSYFNDDVKRLRFVVLVGSLVPLVFYIVWEAIIFGALPLQGPGGLLSLSHSSAPVSALMMMLSHIAQQPGVMLTANIFTSVCVITAFLGVSLCLTDFLADGLKVKKTGWSAVFIYLISFAPPFLLVVLAQKVFMMGIAWAGICCVILLMLLPAWMAWSGRYHRPFVSRFRVMGGKPLLITMIVLSLVIIAVDIYLKVH